MRKSTAATLVLTLASALPFAGGCGRNISPPPPPGSTFPAGMMAAMNYLSPVARVPTDPSFASAYETGVVHTIRTSIEEGEWGGVYIPTNKIVNTRQGVEFVGITIYPVYILGTKDPMDPASLGKQVRMQEFINNLLAIEGADGSIISLPLNTVMLRLKEEYPDIQISETGRSLMIEISRQPALKGDLLSPEGVSFDQNPLFKGARNAALNAVRTETDKAITPHDVIFEYVYPRCVFDDFDRPRECHAKARIFAFTCAEGYEISDQERKEIARIVQEQVIKFAGDYTSPDSLNIDVDQEMIEFMRRTYTSLELTALYKASIQAYKKDAVVNMGTPIVPILGK